MAGMRSTLASLAWLAPRRARAQWQALVPLAVLVAVGAGLTLITTEIGRRTATAYPRFASAAEVGHVEVNPSLFTSEIDTVIRSLPGVRRATTSDLYMARIGDAGAPTRYSQVPNEQVAYGVFGSADGRYLTMDRLAVQSGRAATGSGEAVVTAQLATEYGLAIGDVVPVSFWRTRDDIRALSGEDPLMTPVGVERLRIVGIVTFPHDVLPDELFPVGIMLVSPDVAARYACDAVEPAADLGGVDALLATFPEDCATSYRYWSLLVDDDGRSAEAVQEAFVRAATARNEVLAPALADQARYLLITRTLDTALRDVERSVQPTVTAFRALAWTVATVTLVVLAIVTVRILRAADRERMTWRTLGLSRAAGVGADALPLLAAVVVGIGGAVAAAWTLSTLGPIGSVRQLANPLSRGLDAMSVWSACVLLVSAALVVVGASWGVSTRVAENRRSEARVPTVVRRVPATPGRPEVAEGLRAALASPRDTGFTVSLGTIAVAALVAALTFGASLARLLDTPAWYGWPWDAAAMVGAGYSSATDVDSAGARIALVDGIDEWAGLGFWQSMTVDGIAVPTIVGFGAPSVLDLTVIDGRLPAEIDEIAIGARYAADRGIGIGDTVTIEGELTLVDQATVTGLVVLPSIGPLQSDRASPGHGVLIRSEALDNSADQPFRLLTFFGLQLRDDADPAAVLGSLDPDLYAWDPFSTPRVMVDPVRPPPIVNVQAIRIVPLIASAVLATAAAIGLTAALFATVRARDREIGILKALGFTGTQIRRMITVQSSAILGVTLIIGMPLGIAIGRVAWRTYASQLGVVTQPTVPWTALVMLVVGAVAVALFAARPPGSRAVRAAAADLLERP